jgi:hypothetical protein
MQDGFFASENSGRPRQLYVGAPVRDVPSIDKR